MRCRSHRAIPPISLKATNIAQLHLDSLRNKRSIKSIKAALKALPQGSDAKVDATMYTEAMERISGQPQNDVALATEFLGWIVRARRPLTEIELQYALAVEVEEEVSDFDQGNSLPIAAPTSLCAGLVTKVYSSGIVQLVHYTAQKSFEDSWARCIPTVRKSVALKCVRYLTLLPSSSSSCSRHELNEIAHGVVTSVPELERSHSEEHCCWYLEEKEKNSNIMMRVTRTDMPGCLVPKISTLHEMVLAATLQVLNIL